MSKILPQAVKDNLEKARQAAVAAVEAYNRPGPRFRTAQFVVLIVIAWTALFHGIFYRRGIKPWYRQRGTGRKGIRYVKVDGDPKHWDLSECLREFFGNTTPPERRNLEFIVGLRNKIEHRHLPHLDPSLYGECQASLLNFEALLVAEFGAKHALTDQLSIALQFSQLIPDEKAKAIKATIKAAAAPVTSYVEGFRSSLPAPVLESMKYSFSVFLVPRVANRERTADASVTFVKVDEASPEELERLQRLNVLIREKHIPIANLNLLKPGDVVAKVAESLPHDFNQHHHVCAWRHFAVRPSSKATKRDKTDARYCIFDSAHGDYLYTEAWVEKLASDLADPVRFAQVTGNNPRAKRRANPRDGASK